VKHLPYNLYVYQNASSETSGDCPLSVGTACLTDSDPYSRALQFDAVYAKQPVSTAGKQ